MSAAVRSMTAVTEATVARRLMVAELTSGRFSCQSGRSRSGSLGSGTGALSRGDRPVMHVVAPRGIVLTHASSWLLLSTRL